MKTIVRLSVIVMLAVVVAWLGDLAVTTRAANPPAAGVFRSPHNNHDHHDHDREGAGRFGELGASLALVTVFGTTTVVGTRWSRRLRQRPPISR